MPKLLIVTTVGPSDPTRASIPFHLATNGAAKNGVETAIAFAGDAAELLKREVAAGVRGVGVPALADLIAGCVSNKIHFYVWKGCAEARGVSEKTLEGYDATFITPPDLARLLFEADRTLSF